jgi:hypothetical protein
VRLLRQTSLAERFFHDKIGRMGVQNFLMRQAAKWKMKDMPAAQREQFIGMMEKNPDLFKKIGEEIDRRKKGGENEMKASLEVMKKYRTELAALMQK